MGVTGKPIRLSKAAREFNVGISTIVDYLAKKGVAISASPNTKLEPDMYEMLENEFAAQKSVKEEALKIGIEFKDHRTISIEDQVKSDGDDESDDMDDEVFITDTSISTKEAKEKTAEKKSEIVKEKEDKVAAIEKTVPEPKVVEEVKAVEEKASTPKPDVEEKKDEKKPAEKLVSEEKVEPAPEKLEATKEKDGKDEPAQKDEKDKSTLKVLDTIDLDSINQKTKPAKKSAAEKKKEREQKKLDEQAKKEAATLEKKKADENAKAEAEKLKKEAAEKAEAEAKAAESAAKAEAEKKEQEKEPERDNFIKTKFQKLTGPKIVDKIDLPVEKKKPVASSKDPVSADKRKKRRKRISPSTSSHVKTDQKQQQPQRNAKPGDDRGQRGKTRKGKKERTRPEISDEDVQKQIKETLAKLTGGGKSKAVKHRRDKRHTASQQRQKEIEQQELDKNILKVTEFVTANELASMMDVQVTEVISTCMSLGMFVSINQRLDAETLSLVAEEFGFEVEFVSVDVAEAIHDTGMDDVDKEEDLEPRAPIVTVMGHVDHGKTKLLDYIRSANVVAGEAGGITQHIGAYEVVLKDGKAITFLDTPGHEAFTAMRARGAKVTDVAIIVVAADDNVMPQTKEAINHAQAAGVPIVFAINKIDKPTANPDKIKEELSGMNILVEDWGGKYQSQEISAKQGVNIDELLEKVLLEAEMLDLKANPNKPAFGTVIESSLDKGRGYVAKVLVQDGTMTTGDIVLAGSTMGRVKAMYNERNTRVEKAGPATPVLLLGLNGAPQAGDGFNVMKDEKEAKAIANKRMQLQREQGMRTQKHITLDEIGRRIAIGDFKELNVIVKGDVDGSVEALSDSLLKLSNEQIQVNIILKAVGQVTETDVMLASASDAVIVAFQVRPSMSARKLAEAEQIDIRTYSIIYQAIEEIKAAMEGMLSPDIEEKIVCNVEIREVFKITKVGTVAGCMVLDGTITRKTNVRVIRDGIVVYTGMLGSLKRFKDDVKEVKSGYECGLNIENYNDIKVGDIIEGYEEVEVKRKL
jgi:translation initiation factor IF-2